MSCQNCGCQRCTITNVQSAMQGQLNQQLGPIGSLQPFNLAQVQQTIQSVLDHPGTDSFLSTVDGRSDEEAVLFLLEKQMRQRNEFQEHQRQEAIRHDHEMIEWQDNFLALCQRFRPSIDHALLERIKKLKAFW